MLLPLSWLNDYVKIKLAPKELAWKLTEVGLNTEQILKKDGETIFNSEITPNRPDWLSVVGVAQEVAAIQNSPLVLPKTSPIPKKTKDLSISIKSDVKLCPRYSGIAVTGVKVAPSPSWMQKRLKLVGLRPINNLVDITNYVMFELGVPIHVFDSDKFQSKSLTMFLSKGGEEFQSVDEIKYKLPKDAIIIKDKERVVDLCGIKGGVNTGISDTTRSIFIHVPVYTPHYIRRASQALKVASEASYIYERGANAGGTLRTLQRVVDLVLDLAGGEVASDIIDIKKEKFEPRKMHLSLLRLEQVLGISLKSDDVRSLLSRFGFDSQIKGGELAVTVPTHRGDINEDVDLMEEVARLYGYNNFPKTMPVVKPKTEKIPYEKHFDLQKEAKILLIGAGYTEVKTLGLISENQLNTLQPNIKDALKVANPVSREFVYLQPSVLPGLLEGVKLNQPDRERVMLFETEKVYRGSLSLPRENYSLGIISTVGLFELKGTVELLAERFGVNPSFERIRFGGIWHRSRTAEVVIKNKNKTLGYLGEISPKILADLKIEGQVFAAEIDFDLLEANKKETAYTPIPKYPAQIEDISLVLPPRTQVGDVLNTIKTADRQLSSVELIDIYEEAITLRVEYQHPQKTLTDKEVEKLRKKILERVKKKLGAKLKA